MSLTNNDFWQAYLGYPPLPLPTQSSNTPTKTIIIKNPPTTRTPHSNHTALLSAQTRSFPCCSPPPESTLPTPPAPLPPPPRCSCPRPSSVAA